MSEDEEISQLAWEIYAAALAPASWPEAIEKIANYVGGVAGWVFTRHCVNGAGKIFCHLP